MTAALLRPGDCRDVLAEMAGEGALFDAVVTDPPYHLTSIVDRFGGANAAAAKHGTDGLFARQSRGFMGKQWDGGDIAFDPETWALVRDVMKPGAHLVAFGGTRTFHRMAVAIEDAGFEIRDTVMWLYGTGFPKSHDVAKGIDKTLGTPGSVRPTGNAVARMIPGADQNRDGSWIKDNGREYQPGEYQPGSAEAAAWTGWGTALKPAWEPIIVARKPLAGTVARNVLAHGTGALNIDACRVASEGGAAREGEASQNQRYTDRSATNFAALPGPRGGSPAGRWPANVIHDGSPEVEDAFAAFGERPGQLAAARTDGTLQGNAVYGALGRADQPMQPRGDSGTAARFFYSSKASKADRAASKHPTVKPIALLSYLCRLVTPPGGVILDPFAGSGTTLQAAVEEGFSAVGIEREEEYQADILRRLALMAPVQA